MKKRSFIARLCRRLLTSATALAIAGTASLAQAGSVSVDFNPYGTGATPGSHSLIADFDEAPGNAVAIGVIHNSNGTLVAGQQFTVLYQATMSALSDASGKTVYPPGVFGVPQINVVAKFNEVINASSTPGNASFSIAADQTGSFFRFYSDPTNGANNLAGTGFTNGTLIYDGQVTATPPVSNNASGGSFMATSGTPALFDQHGPDDFGGKQTIQGNGSTNLYTVTRSFNSNYFLTDITNFVFAFNTSTNVPFIQVDPSKQFYDGSATPYVPNLGTVNGFNGTDFQFLADANSSLLAVPEPASLVMTLLGVGGMGLGTFVARRRRAKVAA